VLDAGGIVRHTQVGFQAGDEKRYEALIRELLSRREDVIPSNPPERSGPIDEKTR
jgi:hypothetical protein